MSRNRARWREQERELRPDEVWVPPLHELPESWERDNALFGYRLLRRSGWAGKFYVVVVLAVMALGLLAGLWDTVAAWFGR